MRHCKKICPWIFFLMGPFFLLLYAPGFVANVQAEEREGYTNTQSKLMLRIELDKEKYKVTEPITVRCKFENIVETAFKLKPILLFDTLFYLIEVGEKEGHFIGAHILVRERLRKEDIITLPSHGSHMFVITIFKEAYTMPTKPGDYDLHVIYRNASDDLEGIEVWHGEIRSNTVRFRLEH